LRTNYHWISPNPGIHPIRQFFGIFTGASKKIVHILNLIVVFRKEMSGLANFIKLLIATREVRQDTALEDMIMCRYQASKKIRANADH